jgi:hypothetical protein
LGRKRETRKERLIHRGASFDISSRWIEIVMIR